MRVIQSACGKVTQTEGPWAHTGSGFTLVMVALLLTFSRKLPVLAIAQMFNVPEIASVWQSTRMLRPHGSG